MPPRTTKPRTQPEQEEAKTGNQYGPRTPGSIHGNLTGDPDLRFTANGRAVANFSVAENSRSQNPETGTWEDNEPVYHRVTVWNQAAEHCAENLLRGDRIVATGSFQERTWTNADGEDRVTLEFTAQEIGPSMMFTGAEIKRTERRSRTTGQNNMAKDGWNDEPPF